MSPVDPGEKPRLAVVSAFKEELAPLARRLPGKLKRRLEGQPFVLATFRREPVVLTWTGEGGGNATRGMRNLLEHFDLDGVIGVGVAGGCSPDLEAGSVLVTTRVRLGPETLRSPGDWGLPRDGLQEPSWGTLVTVDEVVGDTAAKAALWEDLGRPRACAVDMESAYWAREALRAQVPFLLMRAVSDCAQESLPAFLHRCRDRSGGVSRTRVLAHTLAHPTVVPALLQLRRRVRLCAANLARVLCRWMEQGTLTVRRVPCPERRE